MKNIKEISLQKYLATLDNVYWNLPSLFKKPTHQYHIIKTLKYRDKHHFSVYGSPCFLWNGGRKGEINLSLLDIEKYIEQMNSIQVPCFTTFTNYFLTEESLNDELGNSILDILSQNTNNGVIISNDTLYNYIKKNYPSLKTKCSVLKSTYENYTHNINWYKRMLDKFDVVVTHPDLPFNLYEELPEKSRIEILVNELCRKNCPNRRTCYLPYIDFSHHQHPMCNQNGECSFSIKEIKNLIDIGYKRFKLQGR